MPRKRKPQSVPDVVPTESPSESVRIAALAGISLSGLDLASLNNRFAQRKAAYDAVRKLPYRGHEPANTFSLDALK